MAKVLVLYYSAYGHIEKMAEAVAEGAREAGAKVDIKRVPELVPPDVAKASHFKLDQAAPVASIAELADYDAIIVGTGTRFGRISSQMASFLDQAGGLWARGALQRQGRRAPSPRPRTQHGGQETTLFSIITNLLHFGLIIVGLPYSFQGQMKTRRSDRRRALWRNDHRRRRRLLASQARTNSPARASKAGMSRKSRRNSSATSARRKIDRMGSYRRQKIRYTPGRRTAPESCMKMPLLATLFVHANHPPGEAPRLRELMLGSCPAIFRPPSSSTGSIRPSRMKSMPMSRIAG